MLPIVGAVLLGLAASQAALMVTSVYLHRSLAHRALRLSPGVRGVCRVLTWVMFGMRPRQWVAVHRKHHAFTDTVRDPHSPRILGYAKVQFANGVLYRRVARDPATLARYARDIPEDRWDRWLLNHAVIGISLGFGFLALLIGWELALVAAMVHGAYYLLAGGAINGVGHRWGRRPYENFATNNQWLAWLVVGEGLHNNHHAAATSYKLNLAKGEFDPGWWCIRLLVRLHWATLRETRAPEQKPSPALDAAVPAHTADQTDGARHPSNPLAELGTT